MSLSRRRQCYHSLLSINKRILLSRQSKKSNHSRSQQTLRIIGGRWRGRVLSFPAIEGLRPTGNRVRETLFNWLQEEMPGSRCLDLFAGSGALGFEALSRGATHCTLLDSNPQVNRQLKKNAENLNAVDAEIVVADALRYLDDEPRQPFDVVFLDPPFAANLWEDAARRLNQNGWLAANGLIYVEEPNRMNGEMPTNWQLHREKRAGQVTYRLYRAQTETTTSR